MKKLICFLGILCSLLSFSQDKKLPILMLVSSYGAGENRPGFEFDEFTQAYLIFRTNGYKVIVSSPKGGAVKPDEYNKSKSYNKVVLNDSFAMLSLQNTLPTNKLKQGDYSAIYIVGGKGAMFDLPFDTSLQDYLSDFYFRNNGIISTLCHGPAALINVRDSAGNYLVKNKKISGFTNEEEEKFGKKWVKEFPFLLESKLIERGAQFHKGGAMLPFVIVEDRLITGQNPYSTTSVAEELVKALGSNPVARERFPDENSMFLLKKALAGDWNWANQELHQNGKSYDIELIAVYGYYQILDDKKDTGTIRTALSIIELATPFMYNEALQFEMAKAYNQIGEKSTAIHLLEQLIKNTPNKQKARDLLNKLKNSK
jgi:putative intracellular protease/amidase